MLLTPRLKIRLASDEEMQVLIHKEQDPEMRAAYSQMLEGSQRYPAQRQWYAVWFICLTSGEIIGDLCYKGLTSDGITEIGYGIDPAFQGNGYAAEAVTALVHWAAEQPGVCTIEAETAPGNFASQNVLLKAGFRPNGITGEEGPRFVWVSDP